MTDLSYFAYTRPDALSAAMDSSTTTVSLTDGATFPDPILPGIGQYTVLIGYGSDREEVCTVTAKPTGNILTVIRGQDGTLASVKNIGDIVVHGVSARDFATSVKNDDPALTDPRVPLPHAPTHAVGGSDPLTPASISAPTTAQMNAAITMAMPFGAIIMWYGMSVPEGWRLCDGTSGTPDLRARFVVGATGTDPGEPYRLGATGGEASHVLTIAEMPAHWHSPQPPFESFLGDYGPGGAKGSATGPYPYLGANATGITGGSAPHENRPPFFVLRYIMKGF